MRHLFLDAKYEGPHNGDAKRGRFALDCGPSPQKKAPGTTSFKGDREYRERGQADEKTSGVPSLLRFQPLMNSLKRILGSACEP